MSAPPAARPPAAARRRPGWLPAAATGLGLAALWEAVARAGWIDPLFFAGPVAAAAALVRLVSGGDLLHHYAVTLGSAALGLLAGSAAGIVAGLACGLSPAARAVAGPYLAALNATPRVALIGILVVWIGLGTGVRVALVAISAFFPLFFNTAEGVRSRDPALDRLARAYAATRGEWFGQVLLPQCLPAALTGSQVAVGRSLVVVVIAEIFVGSLGGVGYFIISAGQQFRAADVFAAAALMALTGSALTLGLSRLGARLTPWHRPPTL